MKKKLYVIIGCDSGIGKACSEKLIQMGRNVAISYFEKNPFASGCLCHAWRLDLRKERQVASFADNIEKLCAGEYEVSCLFSNAGIALGGPVENTPLSVFREVFEVNYFGHVSLIQKMVPLLKMSRGTIMINGSLAGKVALPFMAPYSSSKFALEGFSDSLRRELNPFGIKTVLLEPAAVATPIWIKGRDADRSYIGSVYLQSIGLFVRNFIEAGSRGMPVEKAAEEILRIMEKKKPAPRYIISGGKTGSHIQAMLPSRVMDRLVKKLFGMNYR